MSSPVARLQAISDEERAVLATVLKRKLLFRTFIFSAVILAGIAVVVFFNKFSSSYRVEDNLEVINVVFVVIVVVCARFLFSEYVDYGKEMRSPNKKVVHTKVAARQGNKIVLGNKSFAKHEILLDSTAFDGLQGGEEVVLEISAVSNALFSVKRVSKQ